MNNTYLCKIQECTGCGACKNICPVEAITMEHDRQGFYKPFVDEAKCVNCKRCGSVCPKLGAEELKQCVRKSYAAINRSEFLLKESASGGMYPALAKAFMEKGTRVFAAVYQENFSVEIQEIETIEDLRQGCGSKYVQSQTGDSFRQVESILKAGGSVLYFGLPCQIAGLNKFLERKYDDLYTVDLVCHGVPSEGLFFHYINYMNKKLGSDIVEINHRYKKDKFEKIVAITLRIKTADGREIVKDSAEDPYLLAFRTGISIGDHCTNCSFSSTKRVSDLTIGDFLCLGTISQFKEDISKGVSMLLVNSQKGEKMLQEVKNSIFIEERELKECLVFNTNLWKATRKHPQYEEFYKAVYHEDFSRVRKKYLDTNLKNVLTREIRKLVRKLVGTEGICKYMKYTAERDGTITKINTILSGEET